MFEEGRKNLRLLLRMPAEVLVGNVHLIGFTENVSLNGAFFLPNDASKIDKEMKLKIGRIWLEIANGDFLEFECEIMHAKDKGVGVRFISQDVRPTMKLRQIIESRL